jgi:hypothetical protein
MIAGSFLNWALDTKGTHAQDTVFYSTSAGRAGFLGSAGFVTIVVGLVALLGLAFRTGWLTRLAAAAGVVAFVMFVATMYRVSDIRLGVTDVQLGMWLILAGGILALVGGSLGRRGASAGP